MKFNAATLGVAKAKRKKKRCVFHDKAQERPETSVFVNCAESTSGRALPARDADGRRHVAGRLGRFQMHRHTEKIFFHLALGRPGLGNAGDGDVARHERQTELTLHREGPTTAEERDQHGWDWNGGLNKLAAYFTYSRD